MRIPSIFGGFVVGICSWKSTFVTKARLDQLRGQIATNDKWIIEQSLPTNVRRKSANCDRQAPFRRCARDQTARRLPKRLTPEVAFACQNVVSESPQFKRYNGHRTKITFGAVCFWPDIPPLGMICRLLRKSEYDIGEDGSGNRIRLVKIKI